MDNLDKFTGKFRISIQRNTWGHGETGYELIVFASHDEQEVIKARNRLYALIEQFEWSNNAFSTGS